MKRKFVSILASVLALFTLSSVFVGCGDPSTGEQNPPSQEQPQEPEMPETPETPQEPEKPDDQPAEIIPFNAGLTRYVIAYDGSNSKIKALVGNWKRLLKNTYAIDIATVNAKTSEEEYCEIIVGDVRDGAQVAVDMTREKNDFAICLDGDNDWVFYATDNDAYEYLFEYLTYEITPKIVGGTLIVSELDNFVYSQSTLKDTSCFEYSANVRGEVTQSMMGSNMQALKFTATNGTELPYRLFLPHDYDENKQYPVLLFLHGSGESGNDNYMQLKHVVCDLFEQENSPMYQTIVVVPQCPSGHRWVSSAPENGNYSTQIIGQSAQLAAVSELLDQIAADYSTDLDRYYVMGISMGGFGTWDMIMRYPDRFAAAVPICGAGDPTMASIIKDVPVYTAHGTTDPIVPISGTRAMVDAIRAAGGEKIVYEELVGYGHECWPYIAEKPSVLAWMFSHKLSDRQG